MEADGQTSLLPTRLRTAGGGRREGRGNTNTQPSQSLMPVITKSTSCSSNPFTKYSMLVTLCNKFSASKNDWGIGPSCTKHFHPSGRKLACNFQLASCTQDETGKEHVSAGSQEWRDSMHGGNGRVSHVWGSTAVYLYGRPAPKP
jgi:hypothetical protein